MVGLFGGSKSGVGYLRVWEVVVVVVVEGGGQWFVLGEFLPCGNQKKITCKCYKVFSGIFFCKFCHISRGNC
jgi:hypothetical protein